MTRINDGWDPTPREVVKELRIKPPHNPGETPVVPGHYQNNVDAIDARILDVVTDAHIEHRAGSAAVDLYSRTADADSE